MRQRGQAALEAALVMPLMLLVALCLLQLACAQQARLLLEAAAFHAARAGAVWSGDPSHMQDAARFAMLPTVGATFDARTLGTTWDRAQTLDGQLKAQGDFPDGWVRVETLSPASADFTRASPDAAESGSELEFDGPMGNRGGLELRVRVRALYELRIPFADQVVFLGFFAQRAARLLSFPVVGTGSELPDLGAEANAIEADEGKPLVSHEELAALWTLSRQGLEGSRPRLLLPMSATYRVRMQSNFFRRALAQEAKP